MNYGRFRRACLSIISRSPSPNPPNSTAASPTEIGKIPWWFDLVPSVPISAPSLISAPPSHLKKVFANKRPYSNKHPSGVSTLIPIRALTPENASIPVGVPIFFFRNSPINIRVHGHWYRLWGNFILEMKIFPDQVEGKKIYVKSYLCDCFKEDKGVYLKRRGS